MRTILLTLTVAVLGMACQQDDDPQAIPQSSITHVLLEQASPFHYLKDFQIDFDQDSEPDFVFSVGLEYSGGAEHTKFLAKSIRDSKILLLESSAVAYLSNKEIGANVTLSNVVWNINSGELLVKTRHESSETNWSGSWQANTEGYLGVSFKINGEYHYGWIKLLADIEHEEILVQEYAYNTVPGASIMTGQRK
ncbi:MAG: hypothetical protein RIC35_16585 [Marinoscillum sp.]